MTKKGLWLQTLFVLGLHILFIICFFMTEKDMLTLGKDALVHAAGMTAINVIAYFSVLNTWYFEFEGKCKYSFIGGIGIVAAGIGSEVPLAYIIFIGMIMIAVSLISVYNQKKGKAEQAAADEEATK